MDSASELKCNRGAQVENCGYGQYVRDNYVKCFLKGLYNKPEDQGMCTCIAEWIRLNMQEGTQKAYEPGCAAVSR